MDPRSGNSTAFSQFMPYGSSYMGGVRVATGDVNGDGTPDIITGTSDGTSHVKVFDLFGNEQKSFLAYTPSFAGGVFVAAGDVNGDGLADIITGAGAGAGPHVKVFDGNNGQELASFFAFDGGFSGGVRVATGDVDGDGRADIITATGAGGGPHVKVFNGLTMNPAPDFFAYDPQFLGGVHVAAGDLNGDGLADLVTGQGPGAGPHVKVFDGQSGAERNSFQPFDTSFQGGVRVAVGDLDGDGMAEMFAGVEGGGPGYRIFASNGDRLGSFADTGDSIAIASVPEPASLLAIALGLTALARRRKK